MIRTYIKHVLSFFSPGGNIGLATYWWRSVLAALLLCLGQALSMGCHSMLHGFHLSDCACELPPIIAAFISMSSLLAWPASFAAVHFCDHAPCRCCEHSYILPFHQDCVGLEPWLTAGMVLGWVIALIAAWRCTVLSARRLRDVGKSRLFLLLPYAALLPALLDVDSFATLTLLAMASSLVYLTFLYCSPSDNSVPAEGKKKQPHRSAQDFADVSEGR